MEKPISKSTVSKPSGIPRLSRLPLPQTIAKPSPEKLPVKYDINVPKSRAKDPLEVAKGRVLQRPVRRQESQDEVLTETARQPSPVRRRPRPSLSDRTVETLSQIPPSPSPLRRKPSLYPNESPAKIGSRPASSSSRVRPSTSAGQYPPRLTSTSRPSSPSKHENGNQEPNMTPNKRAVSSYAPSSVLTSDRTSNTGNSTAPSNHCPAKPVVRHHPVASTTLRETIIKAKEAQMAVRAAAFTSLKTPAFDSNAKMYGISGNPIEADTYSLRKRINVALSDGKLNIAALGLKEFPEEVMKMYDYGSLESVDVVKLVAADNAFEEISDEIFPDMSIADAEKLDENLSAMIFRGLESLDLHGNRLSKLPSGLRRLERLTTLNLSRNRLTNGTLHVVCHIESLRELRLAGNALDDSLITSLGTLGKLELLDVRDNAISDLPAEVIRNFKSLHSLIVSGNRLTSLPFETLASLPLTEMDASRNRLSGALLSPSTFDLTSLKSLDVSFNALTSLSDSETTSLPFLQTLDISDNRLKTFPDLSTWTSLITLSVGNNQCHSIPEGMTTLNQLKNVDLSGNDIRKLDDEIGLMKSLSSLRIVGNPLRERKFLGMSTEDLKNELRSR